MSLFQTFWLWLALVSANDSVAIYNDSGRYSYLGCFNETTDIPASDHSRALSDGINQVRPGQMTVPMCLAFCANGATRYRYAGLEWSRECWCSQSLSGIASKLPDSDCGFPCEGDTLTACGGVLKLSIYQLSGSSSRAYPACIVVLLSAFWGLVVAFITI
ncbi:hypothetical protein CDD81_510 [Ophiocordyceps australis]|uniref:WSC domain-containing protein n=1 Tax=Ophiocordyceps australis TaxID=1399860 RepID=A0A2C5Y1J1_9HYPO|nr:hypothetical protein CDD81_510 [Ophiocordyceps australis]